mgnify:CR=1 FL=1
MTEAVIGMLEVIQVQIAQQQTAAAIHLQALLQLRLETLAIDDAGERILGRQVLLSRQLLPVMQTTLQHLGAQTVTRQPVVDVGR